MRFLAEDFSFKNMLGFDVVGATHETVKVVDFTPSEMLIEAFAHRMSGRFSTATR